MEGSIALRDEDNASGFRTIDGNVIENRVQEVDYFHRRKYAVSKSAEE